MIIRSCGPSIGLPFLLLLGLCSQAAAQAAPEPATDTPAAQPSAPPTSQGQDATTPPPPPTFQDSAAPAAPEVTATATAGAGLAAPGEEHARRTLRVFAEHERWQRLAGGYAMMLGGAGTVAAGLLADLSYEQSYGQPMWIIGAVVIVSGGVSMFRPGQLESLEAELGDGAPERLKASWADEARSARTGRHIGGGVSIGLGVVAATAGALIASGVGDMDERPKQDWSVALLLTSGALFGGGLASLLVESPIEQSYRVAYGQSAQAEPAQVQVALAGAPGGGTLNLLGTW